MLIESPSALLPWLFHLMGNNITHNSFVTSFINLGIQQSSQIKQVKMINFIIEGLHKNTLK